MQQEPQPQRIHLVDNNKQVISACQRVLTQVGGGNVQVKHFKGSVEDKAKEPGYTGPDTEEGEMDYFGLRLRILKLNIQ